MQFALGLGLTNQCNLSCPHCYRDPSDVRRLTLSQVQAILDAVAVRSANLGTGENGLHPEFLDIVEVLLNAGIKVSLTSNGLSVARLPDALLKSFHEIELSFDHPTREAQDGFRGAGAWQSAIASLERARELGVEVTVLTVMMATNWEALPDLAALARSLGANYRVNIYQPVRTDRYTLSYAQFWDGLRRVLAEWPLLATTEPVLRAALGMANANGCGCGRSTIRVTPAARVLPCVYWPGEGEPLASLLELGPRIVETPSFVRCRTLAERCSACASLALCGGGCAGRRAVLGRAAEGDPYCPSLGRLPHLEYRLAPRRELVKLGSACTTVFATR